MRHPGCRPREAHWLLFLRTCTSEVKRQRRRRPCALVYLRIRMSTYTCTCTWRRRVASEVVASLGLCAHCELLNVPNILNCRNRQCQLVHEVHQRLLGCARECVSLVRSVADLGRWCFQSHEKGVVQRGD